MDNKQSKIIISALVLIWAFVVAVAGYYVMSYMSDFPFNMKWLLNFIFSTPGIMAILFLSVFWKKKA